MMVVGGEWDEILLRAEFVMEHFLVRTKNFVSK